MFTLLKMIKAFLLPPTWIFLGISISLFLFFRRKNRSGKVILCMTLASYYLLSIEPVAYVLAKSLEKGSADISKIVVEAESVEVIVILAGGAIKSGGNRAYNRIGGTGWARLRHGIKLYRRFKGVLPVLYSGGSGDPFDPVSIEAELAKDYAKSIGISEEKFWIEPISRNTYESGIEIKRILDDRYPGIERHKIILVTSAYHMLRSTLVLKKMGIYVIPSPANFAVGSLELDPLSFFPSVSSFSGSTRILSEWMGICGYWMLGRI